MASAARTPFSNSLTEAELQKELDTMYLKLTGLYMNVTTIDSQAKIYGDAKKIDLAGFNYTARMSSGNLAFDVQSMEEQIKTQKDVKLISETKIKGPDSYIFAKEVNTTLGNVITTERINNIQLTNISGTYYLKTHAKFESSVVTSIITSGSAECDQNLYSPIGFYNISVTPTDGTPITTTTCPDGTQVTSSTPDSTQWFNSDGTVKSSLKARTMNSQNAVASSFEFDPNAGDHGIVELDDLSRTIAGVTYHSYASYYYWVTSWTGNIVDFIVTSIITRLATSWEFGIVGIVATAASVVLGAAFDYWRAAIDGYDVNVLYCEHEFKDYNVAGLTVPFVWAYELGFYTNYGWNGNQRIYTGWYYYPLFLSCVGHQAPISAWGWRHSDRWSLDPPLDYSVTLYSYDESSSNYNNLPICIDGQWVPVGSTAYIPGGSHGFVALDGAGAFHCFYNGTNYFGNSAVITISADTTIISYYYYIPTFTVTLRAIEPYCYFEEYVNVWVDDNYAGMTTTTIQLPLGFHTFQFDGSVWDPMYWMDIYFLFMEDGHTTYGNNVNPAVIPITSDTIITAYY